MSPRENHFHPSAFSSSGRIVVECDKDFCSLRAMISSRLNMADVDVAVIYPTYLNYETISYLRKLKITLIEVRAHSPQRALLKVAPMIAKA
jgi:hypothetical protein